jgi:stringent starvation protein B
MNSRFMEWGDLFNKDSDDRPPTLVTAAVYWGFDQELAPHHLTFQQRAGVTLYSG